MVCRNAFHQNRPPPSRTTRSTTRIKLTHHPLLPLCRKFRGLSPLCVSSGRLGMILDSTKKSGKFQMPFMLLRQTSILHTLPHSSCKVNHLHPPSHTIHHHHTRTHLHLLHEQDAMWMQQSHQTQRGLTQDKLALEF